MTTQDLEIQQLRMRHDIAIGVRAPQNFTEWACVQTSVIDGDPLNDVDDPNNTRAVYFEIHLATGGPQRVMNMNPHSGTGGGYTMPATQEEAIEVGLADGSSMRGVCEIVRTPLITAQQAFLDDKGAEGSIVGPGITRNTTDPTFEAAPSTGFKFSSDVVKVSNTLLRDAPPMGNLLLSALARRIGRRQNRAATVGTGGSEPLGLLTAATVGVTTAVNTGIAFDEILDLIGSLNAEYQAGAALMLHPLILAYLKKRKDGNGNYLWDTSGLEEYPIVLNGHMPSTIVAGAKTILYGDFRRGYRIREAGDIRVSIQRELYIDLDESGYELVQMADSHPTDSAAVRALQISA